MAPSKRNNNKKSKEKKPVSTSRKAKPSRSSKVTTVTKPPYAELEEKVKDICILAERRDNAARLAKEDHKFDLGKNIAELQKTHPSHSICVYGGSPQLTIDAKSSIPTLGIIAVPNKKPPPNFVGYRNKHESDFVIIKDMKQYGLEWKRVANGVYFLTSNRRMTKRSINAMEEETMAMEEHLNLWTRVPSRDWKMNKHEKYDVRFINFVVPDNEGKPIYDAFDKDNGDILRTKTKGEGEDEIKFEGKVESIIETYRLDEEREEEIEGIIREGFENARLRIEDEIDQLSSAGYDKEILEGIKTFKLYPTGTPDMAKVAEMGPYYGKAHSIL